MKGKEVRSKLLLGHWRNVTLEVYHLHVHQLSAPLKHLAMHMHDTNQQLLSDARFNLLKIAISRFTH